MKQKTILFVALTAAFLSVASFSAAQVTIGGSELPKAGTILDLNSTTKGGLALSNVSLTDLEKIPANQLVGITDEQDVNIDLVGMLVYNTNTNFCLGVYVWDGNRWLKAGKNYQVKAADAATVDILSPDIDAILGGEAVTFEVINPGDAQFYYWYLNDVLLDTTETKILITTAISSGDNQEMKVVLDNCLSLSESSSITFNARNIYPNSLPAASGGWIRIFSADAFPYASTDEYIQDGLVAHYDGINNADMGDKYHDNAATVWKNLKGITTLPDAEMCISANCQTQGLGGNISWTSNSAYIDNANVNNWFRINRTDYIPDEYTLEVVYKTNADYISTARDLVSNWNFGGFGFSSSGGIGNGYFDENEVGLVQWLETKELPNPGGGNHYKTSEGIFFAKNQLLTLSGQLINNDIDGCWLSVYVNGEGRSKQISTSAAQTKMPNIPTVWSIGADPQGSGSAACYQKDAHFYSVRVYNTMLSQLQIQHNTALDQKRYLAPPTVTIDGSPCTNVTVLSPRIITCLAPPSGTTGPATVIVDKAEGGNLLTLTNEFEYLP